MTRDTLESATVNKVHAVTQVAETCQLALQRIERERDGAAAAGDDDEVSPYLSVDPMQAAPADTPTAQVRKFCMCAHCPQ
jgi:hypothetical protein